VPIEFHPPVEEYLQTIEYLAEEGGPVIQARLAKRMGKSAPAVSEMLDRLESLGHLTRSRRQISLTEQGRALANRVIRKHRLAERFLVDVIGLPWHKVHLEAGRWEHVISDEVESRLALLLDDPAACPHGNPIPGSAHDPIDQDALMTLAEIGTGESVLLQRLTEEMESDLVTLRYLDDAGFIPGTTALVQVKAPDGTIVLDLGDSLLALGSEVCQKLFVSISAAATPTEGS
jgi:DtxR family Mn-dependent transcriptional regulator